MKKKSFVLNLIYYIFPMVAIIPLSIWGLKQMDKSSYECFFVKGTSMMPTLCGEDNNSTYGFSDGSENAIDHLERFDLVICYYPFSGSSDYNAPYVRNESKLTSKATLKIKRIIGLPGDELDINNEIFSITSTINGERVTTTYGEGFTDIPFERSTPIQKRVAKITLGEDEYFVMGDNWTRDGSIDCCNPYSSEAKPIYRENIAGVIFKLEGVCTYGSVKHCSKCKKQADKETTKCSCGSTNFSYYDDIIEKRPYEDGPIYLK